MIKEFAELLSLTIWDWMAFVIALFSLAIAILSFVIARRTLHSQMNTEKNTIPLFTKEKQYSTFKLLTIQLFSNYINALVMRVVLTNSSPSEVLSDINMARLKIDLREIHLELFYNSEPIDGIEFDTPYVSLSQLKNDIENFNHVCALLGTHLMRPDLNLQTKIKEFDTFIIGELSNLLMLFQTKLEKIFNDKGGIQSIYMYSIINSGFEYYYDESLKEYNSYMSIIKELVDSEMWKLLSYGYNFEQYEGLDEDKIIELLHYMVLGNIKYGAEVIRIPIKQ